MQVFAIWPHSRKVNKQEVSTTIFYLFFFLNVIPEILIQSMHLKSNLYTLYVF